MKKGLRLAGLNLSFFWVKTGVHFQELNSSVQAEFDQAVNWPINGFVGDCNLNVLYLPSMKKETNKTSKQTVRKATSFPQSKS